MPTNTFFLTTFQDGRRSIRANEETYKRECSIILHVCMPPRMSPLLQLFNYIPVTGLRNRLIMGFLKWVDLKVSLMIASNFPKISLYFFHYILR